MLKTISRLVLLVMPLSIVQIAKAQSDTVINNREGFAEFKGKVHNGKKVGVWNQLDKDGNVYKIITYSSDNSTFIAKRFFTPFKIYNTDTTYLKIEYQGYVSNNGEELLDGKYIIYYNTGNVNQKFYYENNNRHGSAVAYYKNGNLSLKSNYCMGILNGEWVKYYENGNIKEKGTYFNGEKLGLWEEYYENGKLKSKGDLISNFHLIKYKDFINFELIVTDKQGAAITPENYTEQMKSTLEMLKNSVRISFPYKMYLKDDLWKYYNEQGNLINEEIYKNGVLLDTKKY